MLLVAIEVAPLPLAYWLQIRAARLPVAAFRAASVAIGIGMVLWVLPFVLMQLFSSWLAFQDRTFEGDPSEPEPVLGWLNLAGVVLYVALFGFVWFRALTQAQRRRSTGANGPAPGPTAEP